MIQAGIDVALPLYEGDTARRKAGALTGLSALVEGIKELQANPLPTSGTRAFRRSASRSIWRRWRGNTAAPLT